jgi:hypothetical protein
MDEGQEEGEGLNVQNVIANNDARLAGQDVLDTHIDLEMLNRIRETV